MKKDTETYNFLPAFAHEIPFEYLRKGTRFKSVNAQGKIVYGEAAMDGHQVSENYGVRTGNTYYTDRPDENYVNVRFDGNEYTSYGSNESIKNRLNLTLFVTKQAHDDYLDDLEHNQLMKNDQAKTAARRELEKKLRTLKSDHDLMGQDIVRIQEDLANL